MSFIVEQIINEPIDSNCYVVYTLNHKGCLIIDPGTEDCVRIFNFLEVKDLCPEYIFLTHEHFDHIWGVNRLKERYQCPIICSSLCSVKLINRKKNMSVFYDQIGFETYPSDIHTEQYDHGLWWNNHHLKFIYTFGHTDCSVSLNIANSIFVGDLMIKGHKTVTKLPTGSKASLYESLNYIIESYDREKTKIYPGHGQPFMLNEVNIEQFIQ